MRIDKPEIIKYIQFNKSHFGSAFFNDTNGYIRLNRKGIVYEGGRILSSRNYNEIIDDAEHVLLDDSTSIEFDVAQTDAYIGYAFSQPRNIRSIHYRQSTDSNYAKQNNTVIEYSDDADIWTSVTNQSPTVQHDTDTTIYTFDDAGAHKYWRIRITSFTTSSNNTFRAEYLTMFDSIYDILKNNTDNWTIDFWVKHSNTNNTQVYITTEDTNGKFWRIKHIQGSGLVFEASDGVVSFNTIASNEITDSNWHHIALIKKANEYGLYKDGNQIGYVQNDLETVIDGVTFNIGSSLAGGNIYAGDYFYGYMNDVRIEKNDCFSANPDSGLTDTITIPTESHKVNENTTLMLYLQDYIDSTGLNNQFRGNQGVTFNYDESPFDKTLVEGSIFLNETTNQIMIVDRESNNSASTNSKILRNFNTEQIDLNNFILNGDFHSDNYWIVSSGSLQRQTSEVIYPSYALQITRNGSDVYAYQDIQNYKGLTYWLSKQTFNKPKIITAGVWCKSDGIINSDDCFMSIDNGYSISKIFYSGSGDWELLTTTLYMYTGGSRLRITLMLQNNDNTVYFDGVCVYEGSWGFAYSKSPLEI